MPSTAITIEEIRALIGMPESTFLDFKAGAALSKDGRYPSELVKDVTGMANAAGGRLVYGLSESKRDGRTYADQIAPVLDPAITIDWVTQVLTSNSAPPVRFFTINEVSVSEGGRIVVIDVDAGSTAHQNSLDHKYYQRIGTVTKPMEDFQIRDVMNRRQSPEIDLQLVRRNVSFQTDRQAFHFEIWFTNSGAVTLSDWVLEIDYPKIALDAGSEAFTNEAHSVASQHTRIEENGREWVRHRYLASSEFMSRRGVDSIHPGQTFTLTHSNGMPRTILLMDDRVYRALEPFRIPLRWKLFMPNARPLLGEQPFSEWANF